MKSPFRLPLVLVTINVAISKAFTVGAVHPQHSCSAAFASSSSSSSSTSSTALHSTAGDAVIMVNGMPGPMATAAAEACLRKGLNLASIATTGPEIAPMTITVHDQVSQRSQDVKLIPVKDMDHVRNGIAELRQSHPTVLAIDYTHPSAVNSNTLFYKEQNIPFVMGTTGGDRIKLVEDMKDHFCVIAPNMGKQIVALQSALEDLAERFPASFGGYKLSVVESHQKTKADTSGTAKAVIQSLKTLATSDFTNDQITMIRDDDEALAFGVPADSLKGHAFHTYSLVSPDGTVEFRLSHNVAGRTIYAEGTADAIKFLASKVMTEKVPQMYTMIDVLKAGALE